MNFATDLLPQLDRIGWSLPLFLVAFASLWLAKALYQKTERFNFHRELTEKDNPAFGLALTGYLLGATLALTGAYPRDPVLGWEPLVEALGWLAAQGVLVACLMRASAWLLSNAVVSKFAVTEEMVEDRNTGAGAVLAGGCIAAGLILRGALSGESASRLLALRDLLAFWALGQCILIAGTRLYNKTIRYDVQGTIANHDNLSAGCSFAGFLIALGILIDAALTGASSQLLKESLLTLVIAAAGLLLLFCTSLIAGRLFLPGTSLAKEVSGDKNPAAGLLSAGCFIAVSLLLAKVISH
jgi:uncharacterized membrane protein YjfL (UPF0719 family)